MRLNWSGFQGISAPLWAEGIRVWPASHISLFLFTPPLATAMRTDYDIKAISGPQSAIFSYFRFNPAVHDLEKPYEILINLPAADTNPDSYRRHNQEFENHTVIVQDVRGRENDYTLDHNGMCWRIWPGPTEWQGIDARGVKDLGHDGIQEGYIKAVEDFIRQELERQDGMKPDIVKVFDWRLRVSMDIKEFETRTINLDDGLDAMIPVTHPHVDQSADGAVTRVRVHMGDEADKLLERRFRIIK
ncbi:hypothetical protein B0I35DRAFT_426086 [Stachybotrys elegans]|uniref:Uncharacterized protein n=1 Tax=Stachybotrys elegans TaxID=80388 RepID=A0A8K0SWW9_9HYPO|nr:hypothetical protein B0I35DRAFT_426086 [Stachybotrys elegans]